MADTTSEHVMQITDKGHLKDLLKTAKALNKELEKSVDLSGGKHTPKSVAAARAASTKESGLSRSVGPSSGTGAESRDFAKQARGLGGLVHLYATFAANVFAATAALTALSKAFDTSNMVKGLDQLGAASGRNLGTLAKKMVAATDGAISLREAMESTAKASSAGLSNKQILEIGDVAKKASQALGVNMVDSVSRLTRGISKLEPELLDELGIFVRIDDAAQKYARTVGKTASSLTDFERRQAFANEVLKQGKEKFGALDIDANPYTKLYATFQDVTQKGLELVNKVLGPLVKLLSESPLALSTVLAGIAGLLLKQAIPAITSWRHNLREAAAEAAKHAKAFKDMLPEKAVSRYENLFDVPKLRAELAKLQKVRDAISAPKPIALDPKVSSMARFKDFGTKSEEDKLKVVNSLLKERQDTLNKIASGEQKSRNTDRYIKEVEHLKASAAELTKVIDLRKRDADIAAKKAELDKAELSAANLTGGKLGWFGRLIDTEEIAARKAEKLRKSAAASMAVAAAADTASIAGIKVAWAELGKTIKDEGITGVQKFATYARGGLAAVFSRVMGLVSGLGQIGMAVGAVIGVFSLLDSWLSNNSKQVERLSSALNTNKEALENVDRTIANINRKPFAEQMTVSSINAKATAAYELGESLNDVAVKLEELNNKRINNNWWDSLKDWVKDLTGFGEKAEVAAAMIDSIRKAAALAGPKSEELIKALKGIADINWDDKKAVESLDTATYNKAVEAVYKFTTAQKASAEVVKDADDSYKKLGLSLTDLQNSFLPKDSMAKLGIDMITAANKTSDSLKEAGGSMAGLLAIANDLSRTQFFSPSTQAFFIENAEGIKQMAAEQAAYTNAIKNSEEEIEKLENRLEELSKIRKSSSFVHMQEGQEKEDPETSATRAKLSAQKAAIDIQKKMLQEAQNKQRVMAKELATSQVEAFAKGAKLIESSLGRAFAENTNKFKQSLNSLVGDTGTRAQAEESFRLKTAEIGLQRANLVAQKGMLDSQESLRVAIEKNTLSQDIAKAEKEGNKELAEQLKAQKKFLEEVVSSGRYTGSKAMSNIREDMGNRDDLARAQVARGAFPNVVSKMGLDAQLQKLGLDAQLATLENIVQKEKINFDTAQLVAKVGETKLKNTKQYYDLLVSTLPYLSEEVIKSKESLEISEKEFANKRELASVQLLINQLQAVMSTKAGNTKANSEALEELKQRKTRLEEIYSTDKSLELTQLAFRKENSRKANEYDNQSFFTNRAIYFESENKLLDLRISNINQLRDSELIAESSKINIITELEKQKELNLHNQRLDNISKEYDARIQNLSHSRSSIISSSAAVGNDPFTDPATVEAVAKITEQINDQVILKNKLIADEKLHTGERLKSLDSMVQANSLLAETNDLAQTLTSAFGSVGESIGSVVTALAQAAIRQGDFSKALAEQNEILDKADPRSKEYADAFNIKEQLQKKSRDSELKTAATVISATKKVFKEKTFAYKALAATEKAIHVIRLAMAVKDMVMDTKQTINAVTNSATRTSTSVVESGVLAVKSVINAMSSLPFPASLAAGAAVAAVVFSLLSKIGGKGGNIPATGASAEEQQKVQGTGQYYNKEGKLVDTGGGVLGDSTAKSKALENGIEALEKYAFKNLGYSNSMLSNLIAIKDNTKNLAGSILKSFPGLTKKPDSSSSGNWLTGSKSSEVVDQGISIKGTVGDIIKGTANFSRYTNTKNTSSGFLSLDKDTDYNVTTEKIDNSDLTNQVAMIFKDVKATLIQAGTDLALTTENSISEIIDNIDLSEQLRISLLGLTGEDAAEAFSSVISAGIDTATAKIFPSLKKFQQVGESFADTVFRIVADVQTVDRVLEQSGIKREKLSETGITATAAQLARVTAAEKAVAAARARTEIITEELAEGESGSIVIGTIKGSIEATNDLAAAEKELAAARSEVETANRSLTTNNIDITEDLIKRAQGLENFVERATFFRDNFLTEEERLRVPTSNVDRIMGSDAITSKMKELGIASVNTVKEFKNLVQALDLNKEADRAVYTSLMEVADAFYKVKKAARIDDLDLELLRLQGEATKALNLERERELELLEETSTELANKKKSIYALQDEQKVKELEIAVLESLGYSYNALLWKRELEYKRLTDIELAYRKYIDAVTDRLKTEKLEIELLKVSGEELEAIKAERAAELRSLSATDQLLKIRIWRLQDEKKQLQAYNSIQIRIQELLGNSSAALELKRKQELETIDKALVPYQLYIYSLEDEASLKTELTTAYQKQKDVLKGSLSSLNDYIKSLKQYKQSLLLSDNSILTPTQKYAQAKQRALQLAAIAQGPAITEDQINARNTALQDLSSATDEWLNISRSLFASSSIYTSDFNTVLSILDKTSGILTSQETDAEKQLGALEEQVDLLGLIEDNTRTFAELLPLYINSRDKSQNIFNTLPDSFTPAAVNQFARVEAGDSGVLYAADSIINGIKGFSSTLQNANSYLIELIGTSGIPAAIQFLVSQGITSAMTDAIMGLKPGTALEIALRLGLPAFAEGGLASGLVTVGERGREVVDFKTPGRVYSAEDTSLMFGNTKDIVDMLDSIKQQLITLRQEQHKQTGDLIGVNIDSTVKTVGAIEESVKSTADATSWNFRNNLKLA